ncbi:hypothetical protein PVK06_008671 [Gossypium arboreum]|uniref:Reverse transcriptase domain-containing protein n=1 Tax=Gossypium arboreum TaxID=29729 RepID=A0ABR0QKL4_GOSAR|nr:hypothetical protein PVK06_008671 [Gossypium arboreum]
MIHDNVLITYELVHYLQSTKNVLNKGFVIKFDMSKAYDIVQWKFIEEVMKRMGYVEVWVNKIMSCVCSVHYMVKCNSTLSDTIVQLGMRMVDQLDNYLGLPLPIGRKKSLAFTNILDRCDCRINGWSKLLLSYGGKGIFIKTIIQSVPTYAFSVFLAPNACPRSNNGKETLIHAMKDCPKVREILMIGRLNKRLIDGRYKQCIDWLEDVLRVLDKKAAADFFTLL